MNPYRAAEQQVARELETLADECVEAAAQLDHHGDRRELEDLANACMELAEILRIPSLNEFKAMSADQRKAWRKSRGVV